MRVLTTDDLRAYLESEQYRDAMRQTFVTSARIGRLLGRFLLDHPWGQYLVKTQVLTDPVLKEQQRHEHKVQILAERIAETMPRAGTEEVELMTRLEPDFQPRTPEQVILETCIDKLTRYQRLARDNYHPNRDLGLCYDICGGRASTHACGAEGNHESNLGTDTCRLQNGGAARSLLSAAVQS